MKNLVIVLITASLTIGAAFTVDAYQKNQQELETIIKIREAQTLISQALTAVSNYKENRLNYEQVTKIMNSVEVACEAVNNTVPMMVKLSDSEEVKEEGELLLYLCE